MSASHPARLIGAAVLSLLFVRSAHAIDKYYSGPLNTPNNTWNSNSNWQNSGGTGVSQPTASDVAHIEIGPGVVNLTAATVNGGLYVQYAPNNPLLLGVTDVVQDGFSMTSAFENFGFGLNGRGRYSQSAGTHNITDYLILGNSVPSAVGTFNLSGGTLTLASGGSGMLLGQFGGGTLNQSGGAATINSALRVGVFQGSRGNVILSGGTLSAASVSFGKDGGAGTFLQTAGTFNAGTNEFAMGVTSTGTGYYSLSGTGVLNSRNLSMGQNLGAATFLQNGGMHTVGSSLSASTMFIGHLSNGKGYYGLSAGTLQTFGGMSVGYEGNGTFDQSGGIATFSATVLLGVFSGGPSGTCLLKGGTFASLSERVGSTGAGTFIQTGGVHLLNSTGTPGNLALGYNPDGTGLYQLAAGRLEGIGKEYIGFFGAGTFQQSGGTHSVGSILTATSGNLLVGAGTNAFGSFQLSGGTLSVNGLTGIGVGETATANDWGNFVHTGGMNSIGSTTNLGQLVLGSGSTSLGNYTLSNSGTLEVIGFEQIFNGVFTQAGGTHRVLTHPADSGSGGIDLGSASGGHAYFNLNGGSLTLAHALHVINNGTFTYNAGTITVDTIAIANNGRVAMSGGQNKVLRTNTLIIDSGGVLDLSDNYVVVDYTGSVGTLKADTLAHIANNRILSSVGDATRRIGYGDNAQLNYTTFGGKPVDSTSLLIRFTLAGDATLDGKVDVADLGALASHWQQTGFWTDGDFDYNGSINVADLGLLATNWQSSLSLSAALAALGLSNVNVPEPSLSVGAVIVLGAMVKRRR